MNVTPLAIYRSKMAFFKRAWQKVKVLSCPWALGFKLVLIQPLKGGILHSGTLGYSKNTSRQSWKNKKQIRLNMDFNSLLRQIHFLFFQLWQLVFLKPLGVPSPGTLSYFRHHITLLIVPRSRNCCLKFALFCRLVLSQICVISKI